MSLDYDVNFMDVCRLYGYLKGLWILEEKIWMFEEDTNVGRIP